MAQSAVSFPKSKSMFEENTLKRMIPICLAFFFLNASARAQTAHAIWAVSDGEKIERDELNSPHKRGNAVWDGKRVKLFGARNEVIAFQLIVEAGASGVCARGRSVQRSGHRPATSMLTGVTAVAPKPAVEPVSGIGDVLRSEDGATRVTPLDEKAS